MKKLHDRAVQAATRFVERRGYGVLGSDWSCEGLAGRIDVIAEDEDAIVFIAVTATDRSRSPTTTSSRASPASAMAVEATAP